MHIKDKKFDLSVLRAANGHIVTYNPQPESPTALLSGFMRETQESLKEAKEVKDWEPKAETPGPGPALDSLLEGFKNLETSSKEVTMIYRSDEFERMLDDIKNFLSTGVAPASGK